MFAERLENPNYRLVIRNGTTVALPVRFSVWDVRYGDHILYIGPRPFKKFEANAIEFNRNLDASLDPDSTDWIEVELIQTVGANNVIHIKRGVVNYYAKRLELTFRDRYGKWPKPVYYRNQLEEAQRRRLQ